MTTYAKMMTTALALSTAAHTVGAVALFTFFAGYTPQQSLTANQMEVVKLMLIEVSPPIPPPKYEQPEVISPAPVEKSATADKPTPPPTALPPPRVEQPTPSPVPSLPIAATVTQLASTAPIVPVSSRTNGVQVTLTPAQPDYFYNPKPRYPYEAKNHGWQGTTLLRVEVQPDGEPKHIEIAQSSGYSILDDASIKAVRSWKFVPARLGDRAITGTVEVPITFKLVAN